MSSVRRHIITADFPADQKLSPDEGWLKMEVRWLVTEESCGSQYSTVGHTVYQPASAGASSMHDLHFHPHAEETICVLSGSGRAISGDEEFLIGPGSVIFVPKGDRHLIENTSQTEPMHVLFIYGGARNLSEAGYQPLDKK